MYISINILAIKYIFGAELRDIYLAIVLFLSIILWYFLLIAIIRLLKLSLKLRNKLNETDQYCFFKEFFGKTCDKVNTWEAIKTLWRKIILISMVIMAAAWFYVFVSSDLPVYIFTNVYNFYEKINHLHP